MSDAAYWSIDHTFKKLTLIKENYSTIIMQLINFCLNSELLIKIIKEKIERKKKKKDTWESSTQ